MDIKIIVQALAKHKLLIRQDVPALPEQTKRVPPEQGKITMKLGEILLMDRVITQAELQRAFEYQQKYPGMMFGQALINLGFATKKTVSKALLKMRQPT